VVGIVIGSLVTMTVLGVTLGVTIYACVVKIYYHKNKSIISESYDTNPDASFYSSRNLSSNSSVNVTPRWISMWDALRMSDYNPTFQPQNGKVKEVPKWIRMVDDFENV
jgi:hypothetical protein